MNGWGIAQWHDALSILQVIVTALSILVVLYLKSAFVSRREHAELEKRVSSCEARHAGAVTRDDLTRISEQVGLVSGRQGVFQAEMNSLNRRIDDGLPRIEDAVRRIEDFLLTERTK